MVEFDIKRSKKAFFNCDEHYIITMGGVVYLRLAGSEGRYDLITATAGEDYGGDVACPNLATLNEAALRASNSLGLEPKEKCDHHGRKYVELCRCEYISDAFRAADRLFKLLEDSSSDRTTSELVEVYSSLAIDDSGEDVYLRDGIWLSSDGSISDRGR